MLSNDFNFIHLKEIDSTNKYATYLLSKTNPIEGTVIRADYQSDGKGQIGRYWHSKADKNLLFSLIIYPTFVNAINQFLLSQCVSIGIVNSLSNFGIPSKIKWPNDIYVGNKKIAGVLIQNQLQGKKIKNTIIGVGINVNQIEFPDVLPNPISLALALDKKIDIKHLLLDLLNEIRISYNLLYTNQEHLLKQTYLKYMYKYEELQLFKKDDKIIEAIVSGITPSGQLILNHNDRQSVIEFRDVQWIIN